MSATLSLTQRRARLGVFASGFILLAVYLFEFSGISINQRGDVAEVVGTITRCDNDRIPRKEAASSSGVRFLFIDTTGDRAYRYGRPESFAAQVAEACAGRAEVKLTYRPYQPLLYDWTGYTVLGLTDMKTGEPYFSVDDYAAWKEQNRFLAMIVTGFAAASLIYLALVWRGVVGNRNVAKVKDRIRVSRPNDEQLLIVSTERSGDSWAFLVLFTGLTVWFLTEVYAGKSALFLFGAAATLFAAYGYLVEVVNTHYFSLDPDALVTFSKPLPWFNRPMRIPAEEIEGFTGEEVLVHSSHGDVVQYAVSVQLAGEPDEVRLFHTRDQAEAKAVAQLANEKLTMG